MSVLIGYAYELLTSIDDTHIAQYALSLKEHYTCFEKPNTDDFRLYNESSFSKKVTQSKLSVEEKKIVASIVIECKDIFLIPNISEDTCMLFDFFIS
jgi:hypothetical protein